MYELTLILNKAAKEPLYLQLTNYIKQEIINGNLPLQEKLPSKRKLARYLEVSYNTIQSAYDQLIAEGFIESVPRKGLYVSLNIEEFVFPRNNEVHSYSKEQENLSVPIDFNSGRIDIKHFPLNTWKKLSIQSIQDKSNDWFHNGEAQGDSNLRKEIAQYLYNSRGVSCSVNQIVIGAGTQILVALICQLIGREEKYAFENPGFHRSRQTMEDLGGIMIPISLDKYGIEMNSLYESKANAVYVTPSHQFPYGMIMPIKRRMELLEWAVKSNSYIIEDDYDGEYRYKGKPIPALFSWDKNDQVIYLGTFSKSLIPSLRISYTVLPKHLVSKYQNHYTIYKQTVSRQHQDTLIRFMQEGYWHSHLNKMRTLYRKKRHILLQTIEKYFGNKVKVIGENSGLHIVLEIMVDKKEEELVKEALASGVKVYPVSTYYFQENKSKFPQILLGYGGLTEEELQEGIKILHASWFLEV